MTTEPRYITRTIIGWILAILYIWGIIYYWSGPALESINNYFYRSTGGG